VHWPDVSERKEIAKRIFHEFHFLNCIAIADGTLFPLMFEPQGDDAPDYHGRKFQYSLTVMIVNDDERKIRHYFSGFPGCAHDNRVYNNTKLAQDPSHYFGKHFYLVSDSAMTNSPSVVSSFKCARGHRLTEEQEQFNTLLGRLRISSEHTIGMLKARFPFLRCIPMVITEKKNSLRGILRYIDCCIILHNMLIGANDDEVPDSWYDSDDDATEIGAAMGEFDSNDDASEIGAAVGEYDLSAPFQIQDTNDTRRERCMNYFRDMGKL
jgi:hypothetical protein